MDIKRVDFDVEAVNALRLEFFPKQQRSSFFKDTQELLAVSGTSMCKNTGLTKGGDLYTVRNNNVLIGVLLNKFYAWNTIKSQLFFYLHHDCVGTNFVSLASFENFFTESNNRKLVGELAYYLVKSQFRGKGFGSQLFDLSLREFDQLLGDNDVFFTLVMGCFCGQSTGPNLQRYLLNLELQENGLKPDGSIKVTGVSVEASKVLRDVNLNLESLVPNEKSVATLKLSEKHGLVFKGYSKNLGLLFVGKA